jgi:type II secretory pathway component GspD/PulD (secretin)
VNRNRNHLLPSRLAAAAGLVAALTVAPVFAQDKAIPIGQPSIAKPVTPRPSGFPNPGRANQPGTGNPAVMQPGNPANRNQPGNPNNPVQEPAGGGEGPVEIPNIDTGDGMIEFSGFAEPVELTTLVEIVAQTLEINIYSDPNLAGSIVFNAPVRVKKERLLDMLRAWLGLYGYTISLDKRTEFYAVMKPDKIDPVFDDAMTTRIFITEGIRPSSLKSMIDGLLGSGSAVVVGGNKGGGGANRAQPMPGGMDENGNPIPNQGNPGGASAGGGGSGGRIVYNDELGMIVMLDTERRIDAVSAVIERVVREYSLITVTDIPLNFVAPAVAKQRILEMLGQAPQTAGRSNNRGGGGFDEYGNPIAQQPQAAAAKTTMDNLAERLTTSPNGNSLLFRGKVEEIELVRSLVTLIDMPSRLEPKTYTVGASAKAIADIARQRGLGEVTTIQSQDEMRSRMNFGYYYDDGRNRQNQNQQQNISGGAVLVVDEGRGQIIYYATQNLHAEMARLIKEIAPEDDAVVMREYRLIHAKAEKLSETILGLINNQTPQGDNESDLLPGGGGMRGGGNQPIIVTPPVYMNQGDLSISGKNSFVIADKENNQVIVKAPLKEQPYYAELISRLDLPVPQVYIEAQIVAVTGSDDFRLAFETQLINANGTGGVVNTNFGLSSFATGTGLTGRKTVSTGLPGFTGAIIKSDQVPLVINALRTQSDSRLLSSPKLLVDANTEEAMVESKESQPTSQRNLSNSANEGDSISFGGYEDAGTKLIVTEPQIGLGDSVRLGVEVELSNFTGEATENLPPPKQVNLIKSQVQVPANRTIVIGGVNIDSTRNTVDKIPLLGDIPFLGFLFQDQNRFKSNTTLYVFITPRIQRDPKFEDSTLLTVGPLKSAGLSPNVPDMKPVLVDFIEIQEPAKPAPTADDSIEDSN